MQLIFDVDKVTRMSFAIVTEEQSSRLLKCPNESGTWLVQSLIIIQQLNDKDREVLRSIRVNHYGYSLDSLKRFKFYLKSPTLITNKSKQDIPATSVFWYYSE